MRFEGGPLVSCSLFSHSFLLQLDVQRQQLLAKQKEAIQQERAEVMGPHGRGPPPMAGAAPFDPRRAAGGMAGGHHPPVPQQQAPQPNNPNELLAALQSVGGGKGKKKRRKLAASVKNCSSILRESGIFP